MLVDSIPLLGDGALLMSFLLLLFLEVVLLDTRPLSAVADLAPDDLLLCLCLPSPLLRLEILDEGLDWLLNAAVGDPLFSDERDL
jgi:hypothetical protein